MLQSAWQDALGAWIFEAQLLARVDDKSGALTMPQRLRVIEAASVDP